MPPPTVYLQPEQGVEVLPVQACSTGVSNKMLFWPQPQFAKRLRNALASAPEGVQPTVPVSEQHSYACCQQVASHSDDATNVPQYCQQMCYIVVLCLDCQICKQVSYQDTRTRVPEITFVTVKHGTLEESQLFHCGYVEDCALRVPLEIQS